MEENKNYAFKFEPENKEMSFKDSNGASMITMEGNGAPLGGDFASNNYTIANHTSKGKTRVRSLKTPGIVRDNIGPGSAGFAGVATLAVIIALAGVLIAYFTLKY